MAESGYTASQHREPEPRRPRVPAAYRPAGGPATAYRGPRSRNGWSRRMCMSWQHGARPAGARAGRCSPPGPKRLRLV